CMQGLEYPWTF
nr:immunoglobulin light chain junction region [Macaca mulatta]MOV74259.1 immunoglobulin light chain junction region [Macaca mulatta]MOV74281.1 immunoglobulin light chain junction region [Macaca mulatta]MOV74285.1 immunoglobulin light chain junction region [Macaca mulatta]MOV74286.1 immunoglobulin light chain junction region [Macaca mulatta]